MLREGYCLPFLRTPPLSNVPIPLPSYSPSSIKGAALEEVTLGLIAKGAVELVPLPSPGFYSRLFVVWKTSGSWRPVIDLSHLNRFVDVSHFQMETIQSVLLSVRQGDWMASIDLKEAYLQVPVHPASRRFLRFVFRGSVYQFKPLCFGLSTAPQVFSRVMAPVSAILHSLGIRMRRYLDDWLVQSSSREALLRDLQTVLGLCHELGIVINPLKSNLVPSQVVQYLGVVIDSTSFRASPSVERVTRLQSTAVAFQSCALPTASLWLSLLGVLSSLAHLVPGGRLRMRSLQLCLHRSWDRQDMDAPLLPSRECLRDLQWWLHLPRLSLGVSLHQVSPDLHFWSDASDVGWGAHLDSQVASGLWDNRQAALSINARELLAVQLGLFQFQSALQGRTVAVFCDNTTAVAYLRKEGGTRSPLLNTLAQEILRWTESLSFRLAPQFLPGSNNVLANALSRPHQLPNTEWSLHMTVFLSLRRLWPVQIDLFATSDNHRCSFTSPLSGIRSQQARTPFSSPGTAIRLMRFLWWLSFRVLSRSSGPPRGRSSLLWLPTGLNALGFRTWSSCRWLLPWSSRPVQTSCACLGLVISTRISVGSGFMPGDSPAIYQSRWLLLRCSRASFTGAPSILTRSVSSPVVHLS